MLRNLFYLFCPVLIIVAAGVSCSDPDDECPTPLCIISGGWKLSEVRLDGELYNESYENYQLILYAPSTDGETVSAFERTSIGGVHDSGSWSIENFNPDANSFSGSLLRLTPDNDPGLREDWKIESITPRMMVLVLERDVTAKDGPAIIRFVLKPF